MTILEFWTFEGSPKLYKILESLVVFWKVLRKIQLLLLQLRRFSNTFGLLQFSEKQNSSATRTKMAGTGCSKLDTNEGVQKV